MERTTFLNAQQEKELQLETGEFVWKLTVTTHGDAFLERYGEKDFIKDTSEKQEVGE